MNIQIRFFIYLISLILLSIILVGFIDLLFNNTSGIYWLGILLIVILFLILLEFIRRDFLKPMLSLEQWGIQYKQQHRQDSLSNNSFKMVQESIDHLVNESEELYDEMNDVLQTQVKRLSKKSSLLETLYAVSSSLNEISDMEQLLSYFLQLFINMTGGNSGVIRLLTDKNELSIASIKGNIDNHLQVNNIKTNDCICGDITINAQERVQFSVHTCAKCIGRQSQKKCHYGTIFIPLTHKGITVGIVNLFFDTTPSLNQDERALLKTISDHLAIALDKAKIDQNAKQLSLNQERIYLSQDIHDSLAQILYSVGMQTSALLDIIKKSTKQEALIKATDIKNNINEANNELRRLLHNFRKPIDNDDLLANIKNIAQTMSQKTGLSIYVHCIDTMSVSTQMEEQIIYIIQEVLINVEKHAKATNIRILLSQKSLIIEDDGCGFKVSNNQNNHGFHLGLNIIKERAMRINAKLSIESEPNEGTQIILKLAN